MTQLMVWIKQFRFKKTVDTCLGTSFQKRSLLEYNEDNQWYRFLILKRISSQKGYTTYLIQRVDGKNIESSLFVASTNDYVSVSIFTIIFV